MTHDVVLHLESISGSSRVAFGSKGSILFARYLEIDGEEVVTEGEVSLRVGGSEGFVELHLYKPTREYQAWANENSPTSVNRLHGYENLRARFTDPNDYLLGTNDDVLILGVRSFSFVEAREPATV
jgi:hypothetical protein